MSKRRRFVFSLAWILAAAFLPGAVADAGTIKVKLFLADGITELNTAPFATVTVTSAVNKIASSVRLNPTTVQATTLTNHGFIAGNLVKIANCSVGGYNGDNFTITSASGKTFQYTCTPSTGGSTGGTAIMYFVRPGTPHKSGDSIVVNTATATDKSITLCFEFAGGITIQDGYLGSMTTDMNISVVLPPTGEILHGFTLGLLNAEGQREVGERIGDPTGADCDGNSVATPRCRRAIFRSRCRCRCR